MAESNGAGRLDRIEALLENLAERQRQFQIIQEHDHEEFTRDHKQLMTWQVLMQEKMDRWQEEMDRQRADRDQQRAESERERKRLDALNEITDRRIADLVRAIDKLIKPDAPASPA